jgi:hypothetical protein
MLSSDLKKALQYEGELNKVGKPQPQPHGVPLTDPLKQRQIFLGDDGELIFLRRRR